MPKPYDLVHLSKKRRIYIPTKERLKKNPLKFDQSFAIIYLILQPITFNQKSQAIFWLSSTRLSPQLRKLFLHLFQSEEISVKIKSRQKVNWTVIKICPKVL